MSNDWRLPITIAGQQLSQDEVERLNLSTIEKEMIMASTHKPEWIEVPAHRILKVSHERLHSDFESYDHNGNCPPEPGVQVYYVFRRSDRKRFKPARFAEASQGWSDYVYLEEA